MHWRGTAHGKRHNHYLLQQLHCASHSLEQMPVLQEVYNGVQHSYMLCGGVVWCVVVWCGGVV